jgi:hypothetical protein
MFSRRIQGINHTTPPVMQTTIQSSQPMQQAPQVTVIVHQQAQQILPQNHVPFGVRTPSFQAQVVQHGSAPMRVYQQPVPAPRLQGINPNVLRGVTQQQIPYQARGSNQKFYK